MSTEAIKSESKSGRSIVRVSSVASSSISDCDKSTTWTSTPLRVRPSIKRAKLKSVSKDACAICGLSLSGAVEAMGIALGSVAGLGLGLGGAAIGLPAGGVHGYCEFVKMCHRNPRMLPNPIVCEAAVYMGMIDGPRIGYRIASNAAFMAVGSLPHKVAKSILKPSMRHLEQAGILHPVWERRLDGLSARMDELTLRPKERAARVREKNRQTRENW